MSFLYQISKRIKIKYALCIRENFLKSLLPKPTLLCLNGYSLYSENNFSSVMFDLNLVLDSSKILINVVF
jgi:hypothetical protein